MAKPNNCKEQNNMNAITLLYSFCKPIIIRYGQKNDWIMNVEQFPASPSRHRHVAP